MKSPIKITDLNLIREAYAKRILKELGARRIFIAAEIAGTWNFQEVNICPHDELFLAQELIEAAMHKYDGD